jgi:hypothetical protein
MTFIEVGRLFGLDIQSNVLISLKEVYIFLKKMKRKEKKRNTDLI